MLGDRYELIRHIARGGMSDVYEARDVLLQRPVAVKVYRATAPADRSRFDAEVTTLAALNHPGLVQVYDAGEHEGDGYVVLELVDGPTLRSILGDRGPLPAVEVAALGSELADALEYVHTAGVVHRDVTPSNVLCGRDGRPRLADFGIARLLDTTRVTALATTVGTAAYMAPEQLEGLDVTPAADIYALGLVLGEVLTGRPGFSGEGHEVALGRLVREPDFGPELAPGWEVLLRSMTARQPDDRPTAATIGTRLAALSVASPGAEAPPAPVQLPVAGDAVTEVVPTAGGTTVMPAVLRPEPGVREVGSFTAAIAAAAAWLALRWPTWLAAGAIALLVALVVSQAGGGLDVPTPTTVAPITVTDPTTTTGPTTTIAPTTTAPPDDDRPGNGNGRGRDNNDDDD